MLLTTVAGSGVGVPTLPLIFMWTSTALHNAVSWKAFVLLLSICSQCLGANRKDILETFTEGPSRWLNKHLVLMHPCVRHHTSHSLQGAGGGGHLCHPLTKRGTIRACHTHTDGCSRVCILNCHHTGAQLDLQILRVQSEVYFSVLTTSSN